MLAEGVLLVGGQVRQLGQEDLALLAEGAGHEGDLGAVGDVLGHGGAGADALVIGMGMHEEQAAIH